MKLLLDTQVFLWLISGDSRLPAPWHAAITSGNSDVAISTASIWEAAIKYQNGKLPLPSPAEVYLPAARVKHRIDSLPITEQSVLQLARLPLLHKDPFDRIIIAQAIDEVRVLVTTDQAIRQYAVNCLP